MWAKWYWNCGELLLSPTRNPKPNSLHCKNMASPSCSINPKHEKFNNWIYLRNRFTARNRCLWFSSFNADQVLTVALPVRLIQHIIHRLTRFNKMFTGHCSVFSAYPFSDLFAHDTRKIRYNRLFKWASHRKKKYTGYSQVMERHKMDRFLQAHGFLGNAQKYLLQKSIFSPSYLTDDNNRNQMLGF